MNWLNWITCSPLTFILKSQIMANQNPDNASYLNFIESLNEILVDVNINKLSYS